MPASALRERFLTHLIRHPDGLSRTCGPDHITASTLVLSADHSQVLLTLHAKARQWFQFGGHCEPEDQTLSGAALREALEESGLEHLRLLPLPIHLDEHAVPFCAAGPDTHHLDVRFLALAPADVRLQSSPQVSPESLDVRWWPINDVPGDESISALIDAALATVSHQA
ncbi:MAG: NUDIX hydrolase [Nocardioidaceae bacterium]|nr:MAG: NUDIX hydrolase [Nocardioidaceae bacterium]